MLASSASSSAMQSTQRRRTLRAFSGVGSLAGGAVLDVRVRCNEVVEVGDFKVHLPVVRGLAVAHVELVLDTWPRIVRNCGRGRKVDEARMVPGLAVPRPCSYADGLQRRPMSLIDTHRLCFRTLIPVPGLVRIWVEVHR